MLMIKLLVDGDFVKEKGYGLEVANPKSFKQEVVDFINKVEFQKLQSIRKNVLCGNGAEAGFCRVYISLKKRIKSMVSLFFRVVGPILFFSFYS